MSKPDPVKEILMAHHRAVGLYNELVELNRIAGNDSALTRAAAESAAAIQFLSEIRNVFDETTERE